MNRKFRTVSLLGIAVLLAAVGCKSTWSMKNPFSSKPEAHVASPAEMDELQLKAPPENYTRGEMPGRNRPQKESLAQNGAYQSESAPGFASADTQAHPLDNASAPIGSQTIPVNQAAAGNGLAAQPLASNGPVQNAPVQNAPIQTAMNPAATPSLPTGSYAAPMGDSYDSPLPSYSAQGAVQSYGYGTAPATGTAQPSEAPVFAPGSIGGY